MLVSWWWAETLLDRLVVLVRDILHGSVIVFTFVADAAPQRMGAREHVRQNNVKALQCISPALLKSLAFAVQRNAFSMHVKEPTTGS